MSNSRGGDEDDDLLKKGKVVGEEEG